MLYFFSPEGVDQVVRVKRSSGLPIQPLSLCVPPPGPGHSRSPERSSMPWTMKVQSRFPLKGTHSASSSWLESSRVTDKELGNRTLEMILWSTILKMFKNLHIGSSPTDDLWGIQLILLSYTNIKHKAMLFKNIYSKNIDLIILE